MDSRERRRVHIRLPVRLRWTTPVAQKIELADTIDVSRSGLLVSTKERPAPGVTGGVTLPYDASVPDGQPEILARVARCDEVLEAIRVTHAREKVQSASASEQERSAELHQRVRTLGVSDARATFAVAFHFEDLPRDSSNGNAHRHEPERRGSMRTALAVPVRVHPERIPWFEEAMTIDTSARGMRFRSHREYELGDHLKIAFEASASAPWHGAGEFRSKVIRIAPVPGSVALDVSVCRVE